MDQSQLTYLNPGIRLTVAALNAAGFETCDSGDGTSHDFGENRQGPYVVVRSSGEMLTYEAEALVDFLELNGIAVSPLSEGDTSGVMIQASYDPKEGAAIIDIMGIHDDMLPDIVVFPVEEPEPEYSA